jgi:EAL domain-containing protein (putative c-di-GMP-specific phosphodiesterase class I)
MTGVEALLRWSHPLRGQVSPTVLVPLAEQSGIITEIGRWILEHACLAHRRWSEAGRTPLTVAINVSAHQVMSPDFAPIVLEILEKTETDPQLVTLEVTESVFVQDSQRALVVLGDLKEIGVKLALDDFGTGYSSLSYLKRFPIDIVKIDQGFIGDIERDAASHAIVMSVIDLAHTLGMSVIAEGVETRSQQAQLAAVGCDQSQGFYFSRPMSESHVDELLQDAHQRGALHFPLLASTIS